MVIGISRLKISAIRNLSTVELSDLGRLNLFHGANGSGKSSLLEAIHILLMGRSFRHHQTRPLIQEGVDSCAVFAEHSDSAGGLHRTGVQKSRDGRTHAKRDGVALESLAALADALPVIALHADSFELVTGAPAQRRQFLDWQLFHVEHAFMTAWRSAQRALSQRNSLIRRGKIDAIQLSSWSREYAIHGERIDCWRRELVDQLTLRLQPILQSLFDKSAPEVEIEYRRGWPAASSLADVLTGDIERELRAGHTLYGPHRADLRLTTGGKAVAEVFSRGQIKLVVAAMRIAQVEMLKAVAKACVVLVDDLGAELDRGHRQRLCQVLSGLEQQLFLTVIEPSELELDLLPQEQIKMFHVEHGRIQAEPL